MGGNFPAGKRKGRNRREKPLILNTRGRFRGRTKSHRESDKTPKSRQDTKNKNIIKNRNLLKYLLITTSSILVRLGQF